LGDSVNVRCRCKASSFRTTETNDVCVNVNRQLVKTQIFISYRYVKQQTPSVGVNLDNFEIMNIEISLLSKIEKIQ